MLLLVDDDKALTETVADLLNSHGHECDVAPSAEIALSMMQKKQYPIVILDMVMDGVGGVGFLERYDAISPTTKVIILTAFPALDTAVPALSGGHKAKAIAYLEKPVNNKRLLSIIEDSLTKLAYGKFSMNLVTNRVSYNGIEVPLTKRPFSVFQLFMTHPEKWMTYQDIGRLLDGVVLTQTEATDRYKTTVYRLRQTLKSVAGYDAIRSRGNNYGFALLNREWLPESN